MALTTMEAGVVEKEGDKASVVMVTVVPVYL